MTNGIGHHEECGGTAKTTATAKQQAKQPAPTKPSKVEGKAQPAKK